MQHDAHACTSKLGPLTQLLAAQEAQALKETAELAQQQLLEARALTETLKQQQEV